MTTHHVTLYLVRIAECASSRNWKRQKTDGDETPPLDTTQTKLNLDDALFIECIDTYCIPNTTDNYISTLEIRSGHDDGRLANTISYILRKLGYPVVNDRFARREASALPRRMKNLLKQKVCIGCYQVDIHTANQHEVVSIEAHKRTSCSFWRDQLDMDNSSKVQLKQSLP